MINSEFEYYLIAELVTMPDRVLAQKIELHIWQDGPYPHLSILGKYVELLKASGDGSEFYRTAQEYLDSCNLEWTSLHGSMLYINSSPSDDQKLGDHLAALAEKQEAQVSDTAIGESIRRILE